MSKLESQIRGALYGLLIGDALGVPYEFHDPSDLPPLEQIEMEPPIGFARAHFGTLPGTWSDDGAQALCLLESLLECGKFDAEDFGKRLVAWHQHGHWAVAGRVFDVGMQTGRSIQNLQRGVPALEAGSSEEYSQGNGSLMRVLPLVLWHKGPDEELVRDAMNQSRVTHGHPVCQVVCALYCLWARLIMNGQSEWPFRLAYENLKKIYAQQPEFLETLQTVIHSDMHLRREGSGYVLDSLYSSEWALRQDRYELVVKKAISLGDDTDTTACIAGGLAGLRDGLEAIPERWLEALRERGSVEALLSLLLARG